MGRWVLQVLGTVCTEAWGWLTWRFSQPALPLQFLEPVATCAPGVECCSSPSHPTQDLPAPL